MKNQNNVDALCIEVFSKISATITHELKNTLSIINENAGFLNDLALMAGDEGGVPSRRIGDATAAIEKQVARSNAIMKNLNRFAHSGDVPVSQANLAELLQLMVDLSSRQAASASIDVTLRCPNDISVTTSLLPLEALVFRVLLAIYNIAGAGTKLSIDAKLAGSDVEVCFQGEAESCNFESCAEGEKELQLALFLKGSVTRGGNTVTLRFARNSQ